MPGGCHRCSRMQAFFTVSKSSMLSFASKQPLRLPAADAASWACRYLIQRLRERFLASGGAIFERTALTAAETAPDGILIKWVDGHVTVVCSSVVGCLPHEPPVLL